MPSCLNRVADWSSRWVPITMSALPSATAFRVCSDSFGVWNRDSCRICTGNWPIRSAKVL